MYMNMLKYLIESDSSFSMFNKKTYWNLFPNIATRGRKAMTNLISSLFQEVVTQVATKLAGVESLSLTADGWSSRASVGHVTVTLHWIDEDWSLASVCLGAPKFEEFTTSQDISLRVKKMLASVGLTRDKIFVATIDRGSNYQKAFREVLDITTTDCVCHVLNGIGLKACEMVTKVDALCRYAQDITFFFKRSNKTTFMLHQEQRNAGEKVCGLKAACPTRWNSKYKLLKRFVRCYPHIEKLARRIPDLQFLFGHANVLIEELEDVMLVLKLISNPLAVLESQEIPHAGDVLIIFASMYTNLQDHVREQETKAAHELRDEIRSLLRQNFPWQKLPEIWLKAVFFDPRFKDFRKLNITLIKNWEQLRNRTLKNIRSELSDVQEKRLSPKNSGSWKLTTRRGCGQVVCHYCYYL